MKVLTLKDRISILAIGSLTFFSILNAVVFAATTPNNVRNGFFIKHQSAKRFNSVQEIDTWSHKQEPKRVAEVLKQGGRNSKQAQLPNKAMNTIIRAPKDDVLKAFDPKFGQLRKVGVSKDAKGNTHNVVLSNVELPNILVRRKTKGKLTVYKMPDSHVAAVLDKNNVPVHLDSVYKNGVKVDFKTQGTKIKGKYHTIMQNLLFNPPAGVRG